MQKTLWGSSICGHEGLEDFMWTTHMWGRNLIMRKFHIQAQNRWLWFSCWPSFGVGYLSFEGLKRFISRNEGKMWIHITSWIHILFTKTSSFKQLQAPPMHARIWTCKNVGMHMCECKSICFWILDHHPLVSNDTIICSPLTTKLIQNWRKETWHMQWNRLRSTLLKGATKLSIF